MGIAAVPVYWRLDFFDSKFFWICAVKVQVNKDEEIYKILADWGRLNPMIKFYQSERLGVTNPKMKPQEKVHPYVNNRLRLWRLKSIKQYVDAVKAQEQKDPDFIPMRDFMRRRGLM